MRHILKWLLLLSLCLGLILGGLLFYSYQTSKKAESSELKRDSSQNTSAIQTKQGRVDKNASNLIFYTSANGKELKEVVVEILESKQERLRYISIPMDTLVHVSSQLYQRLSAVSTEMPQYFQLFRLGSMFESGKRYSYGQLIVDELLNIDSSYYTVIKGEEASFADYRKKIEQAFPLTTEEEVKQAMTSCFKQTRSNLSKKKRKRYAKVYAAIHGSNIEEVTAEGIQYNAGFELDTQRFAVLAAEAGIK